MQDSFRQLKENKNMKIVETSLALGTTHNVRPTSAYVIQKQSTVYALKYHKLQKVKEKEALQKSLLSKFRSQSLIEKTEYQNELERLEDQHLHLNDYHERISVHDYFPQESIIDSTNYKIEQD